MAGGKEGRPAADVWFYHHRVLQVQWLIPTLPAARADLFTAPVTAFENGTGWVSVEGEASWDGLVTACSRGLGTPDSH